MSEPVGEGLLPSVRESLPYLESLHAEAKGVVLAVEGVWQHPGQAGLSRERNSLWRAVCLDWMYDQGMQSNLNRPGPLSVNQYGLEVLHEVEAAAWMARTVLPFSEPERDCLQGCDVLSGSGDEISAREPELFGRWCEWVWENDKPPTTPFEGVEEAAMFVVATDRLSKNLGSVLMEAGLDR